MNDNEQTLQLYTNEKNFDKSPHTIKMDNMVLTKFSRYINKTFKEVKKEDVVTFFNALKSGELQGKRGKYADYTIELYKWLTGTKEPEQVSWLQINIKKAYKHKTKTDVLELTEVEELIKTARTPRNRAIIAVLFDSAARIGEFTNPKNWCDW